MKSKIIILMIAIAGFMTSCGDDFLTLYPSTDVVAGETVTIGIVEENLVSAYQIMLFDDYANSLWSPVNMVFDLCSDDIYKGGGNADDQGQLFPMSEFRATATQDAIGWWAIFYSGLRKCNEVLDGIETLMKEQEEQGIPDQRLPKLKAEALTLRAYYVHWLWKAYGNIPYYTEPWKEEPFIAKQYSFDEMYPIIIADLDAAINTPDNQFPLVDKTGRVSKAMAMMTKARVVMYYKDEDKYAEVLNDMKTIIGNGAWELVKTAAGNYAGEGIPSTTNPIEWIFLREGEFCSESIFEVNCIPEGKSWGNAWAGFGNYTPRFTGGRDLKETPFVSGWGFCPVSRDAYAIFEDGDYRKEASVIEYPEGTYDAAAFQQTGLFLKKYIARPGYNEGTRGDRDLNYENNKRIYRIAEAYLNAAELELATGGSGAQQYLDAIRDRAYGGANPPLTADLENIKLERRREFFGEGMRFFDLVRWGDANILTTNNDFIKRTWNDNAKFLPIPQSEIDKTKGTEFELKQNPGYN